MKKLYIIRHAKSDWKDILLSDFERPLNKRGEKDAPFMGEVLQKSGAKPDLIISSPANRAKTTAMEIAKKVQYEVKEIIYDQNLYLASSEEILEVVKKIEDSEKNVFLFGHNPGLSDFANFISGENIENIPTTGVFCVEFKGKWGELGKDSANLIFFDYPKRHKN